jgi:hypothetical protein
LLGEGAGVLETIGGTIGAIDRISGATGIAGTPET